jgi:transcriptional regulator with XRE-family HTH domain
MRMTQQLFAVHLEVDIRTVQRIEKGEQNFSIDILFRVLKTLNVTAEELLGGI